MRRRDDQLNGLCSPLCAANLMLDRSRNVTPFTSYRLIISCLLNEICGIPFALKRSDQKMVLVYSRQVSLKELRSTVAAANWPAKFGCLTCRELIINSLSGN